MSVRPTWLGRRRALAAGNLVVFHRVRREDLLLGLVTPRLLELRTKQGEQVSSCCFKFGEGSLDPAAKDRVEYHCDNANAKATRGRNQRFSNTTCQFHLTDDLHVTTANFEKRPDHAEDSSE